MNITLIIILVVLLIIIAKIFIKTIKLFFKILFIIIIVGVLLLGYNYYNEKTKWVDEDLECSLSNCDCTCYPEGQTPEEKEGVLCGVNCLGIYNVSSCTVVNNECQAI
ncbi:MAG: hypothetical protein KJ674_00320 [Nanoarchaeota archaeon]|nr:hypothetical protein [Nanoarchaeota archaeon]